MPDHIYEGQAINSPLVGRGAVLVVSSLVTKVRTACCISVWSKAGNFLLSALISCGFINKIMHIML